MLYIQLYQLRADTFVILRYNAIHPNFPKIFIQTKQKIKKNKIFHLDANGNPVTQSVISVTDASGNSVTGISCD